MTINGLSAGSRHISYHRIVEEIDEVIEEHGILGCEAVMCLGLPGELYKK